MKKYKVPAMNDFPYVYNEGGLRTLYLLNRKCFCPHVVLSLFEILEFSTKNKIVYLKYFKENMIDDNKATFYKIKDFGIYNLIYKELKKNK